MDFPALLRRTNFHDRRSLYITLAAPLLTYYLARTLLAALESRSSRQASKIYASPRKSLQLLDRAQDPDGIPYPTDALPGGRDVDTPYGNIRVYEWGPETGRKVLLVHGISTPCIALAGVANLLVERGCRVMLFDLFGRGYSDAPDPELYNQDIQLFSSQILMAVSSSPLAWTGEGARFTMVGYSLGGGISAAFTSYFPRLVEGLVLVAPSGLLRAKHISASSKLLYGGLLPQSLVNYYVRVRLVRLPNAYKAQGSTKTDPATAAESETPASHPAHAENSAAAIFPDRPNISPAKTVAWQVDAHPGFLPAFISSIKHAPVRDQHERWRLIGSRQTAQRGSSEPQEAQALKERKVLVLLGKQDGVIIADEVGPDATEALGKENVKVVGLEGGHDLPIINPGGCVDAITDFWDEGAT